MKIYKMYIGNNLLSMDYYPGCVDLIVTDQDYTSGQINLSMSLHHWRALNQAIEDAHSKGYENDN